MKHMLRFCSKKNKKRVLVRKDNYFLTYFSLLFHFYAPENVKKPLVFFFLSFQGV